MLASGRAALVRWSCTRLRSRLGLPFDVALDDLLADVTSRAQKERARPERRQLEQVWKLLPQEVRAAPLDEPWDICRHRVRIGTDDQVYMVRLDGTLNDLPAVLVHHRFDDLLLSVPHRAYQHFAPPLRTPDDVLHHQVDVVLLVLIVHGSSVLFVNSARKSEGAIHPPAEDRGLSAPVSVKRERSGSLVSHYGAKPAPQIC